MTTSVAAFRNEFSEKVLNFIWGQWCQIGVAGSAFQRSRWVVDPEPLLAFTTEVARHDARMFDEVLNWLVTNGQWINTQRISTIAKRDRIGAPAVIGAIASWMSDHDRSMKWRGVARHLIATARKEALFFAQPNRPAALDEQLEAHFERYGLLRGPVHTRGMAKAVNMKDPLNVMFKSRAAFGIGIRADVMAYLVTTDGGYARQIAEILGYNHMRVSEVLAGMAEAGMVTVHSAGRTKHYRADREQWQSVILPKKSDTPTWLNWRSLTRGLTAIWREVWVLDDTRADAYVFSSKMRKAMQTAKDDLLNSGVPFAIEDDKGYLAEAYLPVFVNSVDGVLHALAGRPQHT
ncbi:MAG: hypothetical protein PHR35_23320 [Kiritimatiellae bacterium]|nr:hypothetical protein [Kiritimatiellia bacterium]